MGQGQASGIRSQGIRLLGGSVGGNTGQTMYSGLPCDGGCHSVRCLLSCLSTCGGKGSSKPKIRWRGWSGKTRSIRAANDIRGSDELGQAVNAGGEPTGRDWGCRRDRDDWGQGMVSMLTRGCWGWIPWTPVSRVCWSRFRSCKAPRGHPGWMSMPLYRGWFDVRIVSCQRKREMDLPHLGRVGKWRSQRGMSRPGRPHCCRLCRSSLLLAGRRPPFFCSAVPHQIRWMHTCLGQDCDGIQDQAGSAGSMFRVWPGPNRLAMQAHDSTAEGPSGHWRCCCTRPSPLS